MGLDSLSNRTAQAPFTKTHFNTKNSVKMTAEAAAATPKAKKVTKPKKAASHPPYKNMVKAAIVALKEKKGSSRQAIIKYILANYKIDDAAKVNTRVKIALKNGLKAGTLKSAKGTGATGSFRVAEKETKKAVKKTPKKKPAGDKKPKKKAPAKAKTAKSPAKKAKSPKKKAAAKKPAAAKPKPAKKAKPAKKSPAKKSQSRQGQEVNFFYWSFSCTNMVSKYLKIIYNVYCQDILDMSFQYSLK